MHISGHPPEYWLNLLRQQPVDVVADWPTRELLPSETTRWLLTHPEDESAIALLILLASDPKWEVRREIAHSMMHLPEPVFGTLLRLLSNDENDYVSDALKRVIQRREPKPQGNGQLRHKGLQQRQKEIEASFGSAAYHMAIQLADRLGNELLRTIAHDIKTILTPIKLSFAKVRKNRTRSADMQAAITRMERGFNDLESLTIAINAFSRPVEIEATTENLGELIGEAVETARTQLRSQGRDSNPVKVTVHAIQPVRARISRPHILMAMTNLIQNAIEAHAERIGLRLGKVCITVAHEENNVRIVVADTGGGLTRGDLAKLKEFIPGHSSKSTGTGYGLPIAKRYIEAHHGSLRLDSIEGRGTTVTVLLPLNFGEH